LRVLIVEDDPAMVDLVRAYLSADVFGPWEVSDAGSVMVAMALAADQQPDVILLDLGLPDGSGLDMLDQLRACCPGIAVVVLTADQDPETGLAAVRAGAEDFLVKGRFPAELIPRTLRYAVERARLHGALAEREERYRALFEGSLGFICVHDLAGRISAVNPAAANALGYEPKDLAGRQLADLVPRRLKDEVTGYLLRLRIQDFDTGLITMTTRSGEERVFEYRNKVQAAIGKGQPYVLAFAVDVTEQRAHEERLRQDSLRDALTGCWNRRWLEQRATSPDFGPTWACILVEMEDLRTGQEGVGLRNVDEALVGMAAFLAGQVRVGDAVVRLDGNEFILLLNHAGEEEAGALVRTLYEAAGVSTPAGFTLGFAVRREREALKDTIARADQRLLAARTASAAAYARRRRTGDG
jgi:PAS domain S-box-containing protein